MGGGKSQDSNDEIKANAFSERLLGLCVFVFFQLTPAGATGSGLAV